MTNALASAPRLPLLSALVFAVALSACASTEEKPDETATTEEAAPAEEPAPAGPPPEGTVAIDTASLSIAPAGGMSRGAAARVALEGTTALQGCYREELRSDGALALKLDLDVEIDAEGSAAMKAANGADAAKLSAGLRTCLGDVVSRWPYDWPNEPVVVPYAVSFTPGTP